MRNRIVTPTTKTLVKTAEIGETAFNRLNRLLKDVDLARLLNISRRQIWKLLKGGLLPEPVRLGGSVRWRESDIMAWINAGCPTNWSSDMAKAGTGGAE